MKQTLGLLLTIVFVFSMASIALARGAPHKQKAFTHTVVVADAVAPNVALRNVPPLSAGYDVICNRTEQSKQIAPDETNALRRAKGHIGNRATSKSVRWQPDIVLLA